MREQNMIMDWEHTFIENILTFCILCWHSSVKCFTEKLNTFWKIISTKQDILCDIYVYNLSSLKNWKHYQCSVSYQDYVFGLPAAILLDDTYV